MLLCTNLFLLYSIFICLVVVFMQSASTSKFPIVYRQFKSQTQPIQYPLKHNQYIKKLHKYFQPACVHINSSTPHTKLFILTLMEKHNITIRLILFFVFFSSFIISTVNAQPNTTTTALGANWLETRTVRFQLYGSQYHRVCADAVNGLAEAAAYCVSLGEGWRLASIPNEEAHATILEGCSSSWGPSDPQFRSLYTSGALHFDSLQKGDWQWAEGRLANSPFFSRKFDASTCSSVQSEFSGQFPPYCPWAAGYIGSETSLMTYLLLDERGIGRPTWVDGPLDLRAGVVCERSQCSSFADCVYDNTVAVVGRYYPDCNCSCKPTASGKRCELVEIDSSQAVTSIPAAFRSKSQYLVKRQPIFNLSDARLYCQAIPTSEGYGSGWYSATAIDYETAQKIAAVAYPYAAFLNAEWKLSGTGYLWGGAGRLANVTLAAYTHVGVNSTCMLDNQAAPCLWGSGQGAPIGNSSYSALRVRFANSSFMPATAVVEAAPPHELNAVVCERSLCGPIDCAPNRTRGATGTLNINCTCNCVPGYWGRKCELPIVVNQGPYTSEYSHACFTNALSFKTARSRCRSTTSGWSDPASWELATIPSAATSDVVMASLDYSTANYYYLAGSDIEFEGTWRWVSGRLKGSIFFIKNKGVQNYSYGGFTFRYSQFSGGQPDNHGAGENFMTFRTSEIRWNDAGIDDGTPISNVMCYICERYPCNITLDCEVGNTRSVSGYYPACVCSCATGTWGTHCEFPIVIDHGTLISEYVHDCAAVPISYNVSRNLCKLKGNEWFQGTIPSAEVQWALNASVLKWVLPTAPTSLEYITGGISAGLKYEWRAGGGRFEGQTFYSGGTLNSYMIPGSAKIFSYSNWMSSEPSNNSQLILGWSPIPSIDTKFLNYWKWNLMGLSTDYIFANAKCYICERFRCSHLTDCVTEHSVGATGFYPSNCTCICQDGYTGSRCELLKVRHDSAFMSHYDPVCSAKNISWPNAYSKCQDRSPRGQWWLATAPSSQVSDLLVLHTNASFFLGGYDNSNPYTYNWRWPDSSRFGKGSPYFQDQTTVLPVWFKNDFGLRFTFTFSGFIFTPGSGSQLLSVNRAGIWRGVNTTEAYCYVCERSPCEAGIDCRNPVSVSGFYPNCTCVCPAGTWGAQCEFPIVVSQNGHYDSEYDVTCTSITWPEAVAFCNNKSDGPWALASTPTAESFDAIAVLMDMGTTRYILGGTDELVEGTWQWVGGRLRNLTFYETNNSIEYSPYRFNFTRFTVIPDGNTVENYLQIWYTIASGVPGMNDYAGHLSTGFPRCIVCERSPCVLKLDCNVSTTTAISGYWPSCVCTCKSGYWGDRCDNSSIVVDHGSYTSEYTVLCPSGNRTYSELSDLCKASSTEWRLASIPSLAASNALTSAVNQSIKIINGRRFALGGQHVSRNGMWYWSSGRLNGYIFFADGVESPFDYPNKSNLLAANSRTFSFSKWQGGMPVGARGDYLFLTYDPLPYAGWGWVGEGSSTKFDSCAVCERSPCSMNDCVIAHTESVDTGQYLSTSSPQCKCRCKTGYFGSYCEGTYPITVDQGPYVSEFEGFCGRQGDWAASKTFCEGRGDGWHFATVPTAQAAAYISAYLGFNNSEYRLAGSDAEEEGTWRWVSGRLSGYTFFTGTDQQHTLPIYSPFEFQFAHWSGIEPNNCCDDKPPGEDYLFAFPAKDTWNDNVITAHNCFLCERSRCRLEADCQPSNTRAVVGVYWPNCTCHCRSRWEGKACTQIKPASVSMSITITPSVSSSWSSPATASPKRTISFLVSRSQPTLVATHSFTATISLVSEGRSASYSRTRYNPLIPVRPEPQIIRSSSAVIVAAAVISPVGGASSVGLALIRAAKCEAEDGELDGANLPAMVHPLRFSFNPTATSSAGYYQAAVVSNTLFIPGAVGLLVGGPIAFAVKIAIRFPSIRQVYQALGFPSIVVLPFTVLAEGTALSIVALLYEGSPLSILCAFIGIAVSGTMIIVWGWALFLRLPFRKMVVEQRPIVGSLAGPLYWLRWSVHARREWVYNKNKESASTVRRKVRRNDLDSDTDDDDGPADDIELDDLDLPGDKSVVKGSISDIRDRQRVEADTLRFSNMISEKMFIGADFFCLVLSFSVGIVEGLDAKGQSAACTVRALAMICLAVAQGILGVFAFIPIEWGFNIAQLVLTGIVSVVTLIALVGAGGLSGNDEEFEGFAVAINMFGLVGIAIGVVRTHSQIFVATRRQRRLSALMREAQKGHSEVLDPSVYADVISDLDLPLLDEEDNCAVPLHEVPTISAPFQVPPENHHSLIRASPKPEEESRAIRYSDPYAGQHAPEVTPQPVSEQDQRQISEILKELLEFENRR